MTEVHDFPSIPAKILLPIDFSSSSRAAFEMAADLALHFHAELHLVHVIPAFPTTTFRDFAPEEAFLQEARAYRHGRDLHSWPLRVASAGLRFDCREDPEACAVPPLASSLGKAEGREEPQGRRFGLRRFREC